MPRKICKDGRIYGQNNKSAGAHLGVLAPKNIRKLTKEENSKRWITYGVSTRFKKGHVPVYTPFQARNKHIFWKGGISKRPYPFDFTKELKEEIRKRDSYTCQVCGCPQSESIKALPIHHIDYNKNNLSEVNLITVCFSCNVRANFNRSYWETYFTQLMLKKVRVI